MGVFYMMHTFALQRDKHFKELEIRGVPPLPNIAYTCIRSLRIDFVLPAAATRKLPPLPKWGLLNKMTALEKLVILVVVRECESPPSFQNIWNENKVNRKLMFALWKGIPENFKERVIWGLKSRPGWGGLPEGYIGHGRVSITRSILEQIVAAIPEEGEEENEDNQESSAVEQISVL